MKTLVGNHDRIASFVPGSTAPPSVPIKVFIEQDQILPVWVRVIHLCVSMTGPSTILIGQEEVGNPATQVLRDVQQVHLISGTSRIVHFQIVSIEIVIALQTLNDQEINWRCSKVE